MLFYRSEIRHVLHNQTVMNLGFTWTHFHSRCITFSGTKFEHNHLTHNIINVVLIHVVWQPSYSSTNHEIGIFKTNSQTPFICTRCPVIRHSPAVDNSASYISGISDNIPGIVLLDEHKLT